MARQTKPLSTTEIEKSKPKDKLYRLYDGNGLVLNITPNGGKYWYVQYKHPITKKAQMYKLGDYPKMSLANAREQCQECQKLIADNIDPKTHYELEHQARINAITNDFKAVFNEWLETKKYAPKTQEKMQNYQRELLAVIGNKPVCDITVPDLMLVLKPIERAGQFAKLEKMRTMINQALAYAVATGRTNVNPAVNIKGAFATGEVRHNPAILDENRLADLVKAIDGYHGYFVTRLALMFAMIVFARPGEIRHMTWEQIDIEQGLWSYTPSKTRKSTSVHIVSPLPCQAIEILRQAKEHSPNSEYVFPSTITTARPLSENTLNQALRRMGFDSSEQTSHGFRAIARTLLEEKFKYDYRMIEMQLGHQVRDSNGRAYNRVQWIDERREMLQTWADYLDSLK